MKCWKNINIDLDKNMSDAIELLENTKKGILLVTDNMNSLIGTVTDGDIRRAIINKKPLNSPVIDFCNHHPVTITKGNIRPGEKIFDSKLICVPIVDHNSCMIDILWADSTAKIDNPILLMAGGFGKRLMPLTDSIPKPMLMVGDSPILETIIKGLSEYGFWNFYISTHYKSEYIRNHFGDGKNLGVSIKYIHESEPLGTAGAVSLLPDDISSLPMIVMNGDILTKVNFKGLLDYHNENKAEITICAKEYDFQVPYGVIKFDGGRVVEIIEKPIHNFFISSGIYVLENKLIKSMPKNKYIDMTEVINNSIGRGEVAGYPMYEYWLDIGGMSEFEKAQVDIKEIF